MAETTEITRRVERGARWLDENAPGWPTRIDIGGLDLRDGCRCVLGQLYGDFLDSPDDVWPVMAEYGFCSCTELENEEYAALDEAWIALIKTRRSQAGDGDA